MRESDERVEHALHAATRPTMTETTLQPEARTRVQVLGFAFGAAMTVLFIPLEAALLGVRPSLIWVRLAWAAFLVVAALIARAGDRRRSFWTVLASSVLSTTALTVITAQTGGLESPYLIWLSGFAISLIPYSRRATLVSGLISVLAVAWFSLGADRSNAMAVLEVMSIVMVAALAVSTAFVFQALRRAQSRAAEQLAESERRRAVSERMATTGQLAAGVAHEINNPLGFVRANLQYLAAEEVSREEREEVLRETLDGVDRIHRIVQDLRAFTRADAAQLQEVEVRAVLEDAVRLVLPKAKARDVHLELAVADGLPRVEWPTGRIVQVLVHLLANAVDAFSDPREGTRRVTLFAAAHRGQIQLRIADNGPGIPPELRSRLFDPFFTTKPVGEGTGLGLALAREYVLQSGGTLRFVETPGGGATFELELGLVAVTPEAPAAEGAAARTARYDR